MASHSPERPNILFIMSDDQGQWACGCYGNDEIETPAIDSIASQGMRCDDFFCVSPVCSPARASVLTGMIPSQHGIHDWLREGNIGDDSADYLGGIGAYTETLADAGYRCGLSGKWHLGDSIRPQKGISHWYAHQTGGGPYFGAPMIRDGVPCTEERYVTDAITDDALCFLDQAARDDRPFSLNVHYTAPHSPWLDNHPEELLSLYDGCDFASCPDEAWHPWADNSVRWALERQSEQVGWEETRRTNLAGYYAAVTGMDRGIRKLLDRLERHHLVDSTLVVFTSDNGMNMGHHGIWGKGNGSWPQNMFDTSVKVPFVVSCPARIPKEAVCTELVSGYDVAPTLLDLVGIGGTEPTGPGRRGPGRSVRHLLEADDVEHGRPGTGGIDEADEVVVFDEYGPVRMIRTREWKYVHRFHYGPHELYDLLNDPGERDNRVDDPAQSARVREMRDRLGRWFDTWVDPARDGSRYRVTGMGQLSPVSASGESFVPFGRPEN